MVSNKSSFFFILWRHPNLIIVGERIHESEKLVARGCIHQLVDSGQRVTVLRTGFIQLFEVYAHPLFTVCLLNQDHIGNPARIVDLSDEPGFHEFINFLGYCHLSFRCMTSNFFLHWLVFGINSQTVFHNLGIDHCHVRRNPSKNIHILL